MRIGICDNNAQHLQYIDLLLRQMRELSMSTVVSYCDAEWLLADLTQRCEAFDILILNVKLEQSDGLAIARLSLERNQHCQVIFITENNLQCPACYGVRHVYMLPRETLSTQLIVAIQAAVARLNAAHAEWLTVSVSGDKYILDTSQILYLERVQRQTVLVMADSRLTTYQTPQQLTEHLNASHFLRCHRSIIVNLHAVARYQADMFFLKNGETLPIGRQHRQEVRDAMSRFISETLFGGTKTDLTTHIAI